MAKDLRTSVAHVNFILTHWTCLKCGGKQDLPVGDFPTVGIPVCTDCEDEMEMEEFATISTIPGEKAAFDALNKHKKEKNDE